MFPVTSLWLPILVSAVLVFFASLILHMVLPLHRNDWRKLPAEDDVMAALRKFNLSPGDYAMPCGWRQRDERPGVQGEDAAPGGVLHRAAGRRLLDGQQSRPVVRLQPRRQSLCGLHHRGRAAPWRSSISKRFVLPAPPRSPCTCSGSCRNPFGTSARGARS